MKRFLIAAACLCLTLPSLARQDPAEIRKAVEDFLRIQTKGLPGQASYSVGAIAGSNLMPCPALDVALPAGARLWGRSTVIVRCHGEPGWTLYVPVHVRVRGDYVVTARSLAQGQIVAAGDLARQTGDLTDLPAGVLTDPSQAVGRNLTLPVAAGRPLRADMLRQAPAVQQNQTVKILSKGPGFMVSNEGRALNNAMEGQVVQVRLANGQILSGIARRGGVVEVTY